MLLLFRCPFRGSFLGGKGLRAISGRVVSEMASVGFPFE